MRTLILLGFVAFPLLVYFLADRVPPAVIVIVFVSLALARLAFVSSIDRRLLTAAFAALAAFGWLATRDEDLLVLKLYPVAISAAGAVFFLFTLWRPPSAIERLLQATGDAVSDRGRTYVRGVTAVWAVFFVLNGAIALWTATSAPTSTWALYNGVVSYAAIGILFSIEYAVRVWYRSRA